VNRSVRAVQNGNLFNRTSSLRQPMAANVNQIRPNIQQTRFSFRPPVGANPQNVRSYNAPFAIKRSQRLPSICDHDLVGFCAILNLNCLS
jgi:hypothetical protein